MEIEKYIKYFYDYISTYRKELQKIKDGWKENRPGLYLFSPLIGRTYIIWLLHFIKQHTSDTSQMEKDFQELDKTYVDYKEKNRDEYFQKVLSNFKWLVKDYRPEAVLNGGYTFETVIIDRTYIEIFSKELTGVFDVSKDMDVVKRLDLVLKEKIKEAVKEKTYSPQDRPYAPREYWWLHLEELYGIPEEIID